MIALSKNGETASVTIQECSASVQAFLVSARELSKLLLAISTEAEEIRLSLNPANASMTKAVEAIGRVSVGASTMSGSLSVIAKSIEQTNGHFLRAISYAGSVNMGVQALEARLLKLSWALAVGVLLCYAQVRHLKPPLENPRRLHLQATHLKSRCATTG